MEQLTVHHIRPFGDSVFDRYCQWVDRLFSVVVRKTLVVPLVWLTQIPLYLCIIKCADAVMNNESCGFCEDTDRLNNYINARKELIKIIDTFHPLTFLPKNPLIYRRKQLQMAQEYWEDKQKKGDRYYTELLGKVAKKYSKV